VRKLAGAAVDAAKGTKSTTANKIIRRLAAHAVAGLGMREAGPLGFAVGHALGWAANAGAVAGRAKLAIKYAAEALLKNGRNRLLARAITQAKDRRDHERDLEHYGVPAETLRDRAQLITRAASDEDATRQAIRNSLGPFAEEHPETAKGIEDTTVMRLKNLAVRLPVFTRLGNVGVQDARRFEEYEDATWHPEVILDAVASGKVTPLVARALAEQHPELQRMLTEELFADPETVRNLPPKLLHQVELITGTSLTRATDPGFILRQQTAAAPQPGPQGGGRAQAFKITAPAPTPSQAYGMNGRAPGN
jgi:hypothetical protein